MNERVFRVTDKRGIAARNEYYKEEEGGRRHLIRVEYIKPGTYGMTIPKERRQDFSLDWEAIVNRKLPSWKELSSADFDSAWHKAMGAEDHRL